MDGRPNNISGHMQVLICSISDQLSVLLSFTESADKSYFMYCLDAPHCVTGMSGDYRQCIMYICICVHACCTKMMECIVYIHAVL